MSSSMTRCSPMTHPICRLSRSGLPRQDEPAAEEAETALAEGVDIRQGQVPHPAYRAVRAGDRSPGSDTSAADRISACRGPVCADLPAARIGQNYPDLRERLVANVFDAGLKAFAAFVAATRSLKLTTHRALGRKAFVDAVSRADRSIDDVAASFDFLLAVTPINADAAWQEFRENKCKRTPQFLYRPLSVQVATEKRKLFSVAFDRFEDPVLYHLYREKQQELDLQLSLISARETSRFVEYSRALYGRSNRRCTALLRTSWPKRRNSPMKAMTARPIPRSPIATMSKLPPAR